MQPKKMAALFETDAERRQRHARNARIAEERALSASSIACAVADAWASPHSVEEGGISSDLFVALDALEAATRESPLRKVRP